MSQTCPTRSLLFRTLVAADYQQTHSAMLNKTIERFEQKKQGQLTADELWIVEHNDVYTLGQAGKESHILQRGNTPIIKTDRGGQVTWHGRGQLVLYCLFDLNALGWSVRDLVSHTEQSIEDVLNDSLKNKSFYAKARKDAPGVYIYNNDDVMLGKIASLGFKIKHGFSYHGLSLNLTCDLSVFNAINPCGYAGMQMLKLEDFVPLNKITQQDQRPKDNRESVDFNIKKNTISELQITRQLVNNIEQRQSGLIALRQ